MSAQRREPGHDPFKSLKIFVFSSDKASDILTMSLKAFMMLVFVITSISLVVYSIFGGQSRWWFDYPGDCPTRNTFQPTHLSQSELSESTNISHIVFGIGASSNTWQHRRQYSQLWWQPNVTRGYILLDKKPDPNLDWPESSPPYRVSEDWSRFKFSSSQSGVRIARIVVELFQIGLPEVRWFVMGDDDTVFFIDNLITVLAKYDHREMYYIGGNSESVEQDVMHSYGMAFGGGGFAVSYPLAAELAKAMDGCLDRYYRFYGSDQRVWACVSEFGVSLTKEPGFHQVRFVGKV